MTAATSAKLPIALEPGERLLLAVRPDPGVFGMLWALPFMLALFGVWSHFRPDAPEWNWGVHALSAVIAGGAFFVWQRGLFVFTDRRLVWRGFLGSIDAVAWAEVESLATSGTMVDRMTGYGPRQRPLFIRTRSGKSIRLRRIPHLAQGLAAVTPYLPQDVAARLA